MTKRTSIAIRVLMYCGVNDGDRITKSQIAESCQVSENHLAQVINQLGHLGYLDTRRGRNGGLKLARPMKELRVGEVFRAVEVPVPPSECFADADNSCLLGDVCSLRAALADAEEAFYAHLDGIMLDELIRDNPGLYRVLRPARTDMPVAR